MKIYKRNKANIWLFIISTIIYILVNKKIDISSFLDGSIINNLITISSIFAGFMYTILGNMVEFSTRESIQLLDKVGHVDKYYSATNIGLYSFILSILLFIVTLFFPNSKIITASVYCIYLGIIYFILSTYYMNKIIKIVRKY